MRVFVISSIIPVSFSLNISAFVGIALEIVVPRLGDGVENYNDSTDYCADKCNDS